MNERKLIDSIKEHNWKESWLDFSVFHYEKNQLTIVGSDDFSYYHNVEIIIENPSYINGVMDWSCDIEDNFISLVKHNNDKEIFELEFYSDSELKFKVILASLSVNFDTVYYYKRGDLKAGERLAYWVK